ncbi:MAG: trehalase family glycosidase, partial [Hungatella sp.]
MAINYDEELSYSNRCLRTQTGKLLFGPNGDRLAVDILNRKPGFSGCIDFIHKMNVTELFTVQCSFPVDFEQAEAVWYRTHMLFTYENDDLKFEEKKTIVAEDAAVSVMKWTNCSTTSMQLTFQCAPQKFSNAQVCPESKKYVCYDTESPELRFGIRLGIVAGWNFSYPSIEVEAGKTVVILGVAAMGNLTQESKSSILDKVIRYLDESEQPDALFERLLMENQKFYAEVPGFLCDDPLINACWKYRWYILKNAMCKPRMGNFMETVMYEGRDHRMRKDPLDPHGWEFSKLIPLSTPLQVNDLRWHSNSGLIQEIIRSAFASQDEDGLLLCSYVETYGKSYANYMIWAIWLNYLLHPDRAFIEELLPKMKHYIAGHEKIYQDEKDSLCIEKTHQLTGKEYQPSYWFFHNYPNNPKDPSTYTPLKRVDRSVYHYQNLIGMANLLKALGDPEEEVYRNKATVLRKDINDKMWDEKTGFYYDLHYQTEEKAMVRNIVGIYPYWAGMADPEKDAGIMPLMDAEAFDTGAAFASVSKDCPVFSPAGGWKGNYLKGRNGCVWCGPSWPYTTGIALEALGTESRKRDHLFDAEFDRYFQEYTTQHFRDGNRHRPYLVEHYDAQTGERLSD